MIEEYFRISKADKLSFYGGKVVDTLDIGSIGKLKRFIEGTKDVQTKMDLALKDNERRYEFTGSTVEGFNDILERGSDDIISLLKDVTKKELKRLNDRYDIEKIEYLLDCEGDFFDVGIVMSGEPECWLKEIRTTEKKTLIELNVLGSYSWRKDQKDIISNAGLILAYCKFFEERGIQTKIMVHFISTNEITGRGASNAYHYKILAKDQNQNIDYAKVSAILHPSFFRRGMFRVKEIRHNGKQDESYGRSVETKGVLRLDDISTINTIEKLFKKGTK